VYRFAHFGPYLVHIAKSKTSYNSERGNIRLSNDVISVSYNFCASSGNSQLPSQFCCSKDSVAFLEFSFSLFASGY
jgi:hypothetical protein